MTIKTICIYGAGALGGAFAAKLSKAHGETIDISVVARGAQLDAIRSKGVSIVYDRDDLEPITARVTATDDPTTLPKQDLIITGMKGHQLADAVDGMACLLKDDTRVAMILNGIPWWYFHGDKESGFEGRQLADLDPGNRIWSAIGPERVIGCVAYQGAEVIEPGCTRLSGNGYFFVGEPDGTLSPDLQAITSLLTQANLDARAVSRIRDEIWAKLRGNAAFNPISALTRALMVDIMANPVLADMVRRIMNEVQTVGSALGCRFTKSADEQFASASGFGPVKTSMLQDLSAGKALEIVPLTGMVVALGKLANVATPVCDTIFTLTVQLDRENRRA